MRKEQILPSPTAPTEEEVELSTHSSILWK